MKHLLLTFLFLIGIAVSQPIKPNLKKEYELGLKYYNQENPTEISDQKALDIFLKITNNFPNSKDDGKIIAESAEKTGVLFQALNQNQKASNYYKKAILVSRNQNLSDSLVFKPLLYLSGLHYYNAQYDSCLCYLSEAEKLYAKNSDLPDAERLFNTKGVLLFESGNFRQSLSYFQKAEYLEGTDLFSNQNNQALALQFLNRPDSTYKILKKLEKEFPNEVSLKINIASVLIELNRANEAIKTLNNQKIINDSLIFNNTYGKAYFHLNDLQSSRYYFEKAKKSKLGISKNSDLAYTEFYLGLISKKQNHYFEALVHFQNALNNTDYFFTKRNIFLNPSNFEGNFYTFFMLDILSEKAKTFEILYDKTKEERYLRGSLNTFEALKKIAFNLAKTYNQENARLDIIAKIHPHFQAFTNILWKAFENTKNVKYAERAFETAEIGKAAVLEMSISEGSFKTNSDIPDSLLLLEKNLQISLNALKRNIEGKSPSQEKEYLKAINETEIKIANLNSKLESFPEYKKFKYEENLNFSLEKLRQNINNEEIIISYADLKNKSLVFAISKNEFIFHKIQNQKFEFESAIKTFKSEIMGTQKSNSRELIYNELISPFEKIIKSNKEIIFIADGITNGLPMEILRTKNNKYLIENHPISYQFSAKFLLNNQKKAINRNVFAIAPFADVVNSKDYLPNSKNEIQKIPNAKINLGSTATKSSFLKNYQNFGILHLATHAVSDIQNPEKSFIRFSDKNQKDDKLFLYEFSAGQLSNTSLVILSACDSYGKNIADGEGIRGLSRGFYLAGSQNIISSLWQAEDFTTAYLLKQFYIHLNQGESFTKALQMSKIDLLNDPKMAQFKQPKFWAPLIFVGNSEQKNNNYFASMLAIFLLSVFLYFYTKKSRFQS